MDNASGEPSTGVEDEDRAALRHCVSLRAAGDLHGALEAARMACATAPPRRARTLDGALARGAAESDPDGGAA